MGENISYCNECGEQVPVNAKFCQSCGNKRIKNGTNIDDEHKPNKKLDEKSPTTAAVLNIIIAGIGFVYIGEYAKGLLSFIGIFVVAYFLGLIWGIIALIIVMIWTYDETKKYNKNLRTIS